MIYKVKTTYRNDNEVKVTTFGATGKDGSITFDKEKIRTGTVKLPFYTDVLKVTTEEYTL